jgi:putative CocE/NonD family hydrolase
MQNDNENPDRVSRRDLLLGINAALLALSTGPGLPALARNAASSPAGTYDVHEIENSWIPMPDGVKLAARIWLPDSAKQHPVPALFNYCPYFARLNSRLGDETRFPYYASHGYACVRVDIRGSGDSDGKPLDEYVKQEQDDGVEIIKWIAAQHWCTGAVGMEGISWSGFNSLQVAARRPPALKAIITHCSTDDRYTDDAHYKGGCIVNDMFGWGTEYLAKQGTPSDPDITGRVGWRERWLERLNAVEFNLGTWLTHPHRDDFWKHGSVNEDYAQIACPVYTIGGWVDGYKNSVFRLLAGLKVPCKGLVGPWTHVYPHRGVPGPAIGYLDEALRWWDHWLKGRATGIMDEPILRVWMQDKSAQPDEPNVPGRWAAEESWPSRRIAEQRYFMNGARRLDSSAAKEERVALEPLQTVGGASGNWCPSGAGTSADLRIDLPLDQRIDDARSLVFDSAPLTEPVEILGAPAVILSLAVDKPVAFVAVRLNEVRPTGESSRVTYGILNLCHRDGDASPAPLEPGRRYEVRVQLDNIAHRFQPGNAIRVAISTTYWPLIVPSPEPVTLSLFSGASALILPVRPPRPEDSRLKAFGPPFVPTIEAHTASSKPGIRVVETDTGSQDQMIRYEVGNGSVMIDSVRTRLMGDIKMRYGIRDNDTAAAVIEAEITAGWERDNWRPRLLASSRFTTTKEEFVIVGELSAFDGDEKVLTRTWNQKIPRQLV